MPAPEVARSQNWIGGRTLSDDRSRGSCREAAQTARRIVQLREDIRQRAQTTGMSASAFRLLDYLFQQPVINVNAAGVQLEISYQATNALIRELREVGVLGEITGGSRNRRFRFWPYLDLFQDVAVDQAEAADPQRTLR